MTTIQITRLSHEGRGVGRDDSGKTVFVDGVLPGEIISYELKHKKPRFNEARLLEVLTASSERVTPQCSHFLTCGGCSQQHISHAAQLEAKQRSLLEQLQHFGQVSPQNILPPLSGPLWGYRTKARLGVKYVIKKEKVLVGFREKQKSYLADIESCEVLHPKAGKIIDQLKLLIQNLHAYQAIAQIEVAVGDDRMALIFRNLQDLNADDQQALINFAQQQDFDLYLQPAGPDSIHKIWPQETTERLFYSLPAQSLKLAFYPTDFTQVNPDLNRQMVNQAIDLLQLNANDRVLDLFCGLGNFTLAMARTAAFVTGVEGSEQMVQRGYENAKLNDIQNVEFMAADLSKDQSTATWAKQHYTKILLDPPRSGAQEILSLVAKLAVERILYVSCNPATLARDSGILCKEYGYTLVQAGIMDMFPHTMHVESMALFIRK